LSDDVPKKLGAMNNLRVDPGSWLLGRGPRTGISEAHCSILAVEGASLIGGGGVGVECVGVLEVECGGGGGREPRGDGLGRGFSIVPFSLAK
jgi:hypothetical protein